MTADTRLYDMKGRPYERGISFYKLDNNLIRVPSMFGPKTAIMKYLSACIGLDVSNIEDTTYQAETIVYLRELWKDGERKTKNILEMLNTRANKLKASGSVVHLVYQRLHKILSDLSVPIFNIQQVSNIRNISPEILREINLILED